ncbi:MAG: ATP-binding cassette domain-containing protein [Chloroflexi bacterium]|nr:ATP-binding cassette domain-containing protein [Chloroflexota bacterium]
MVIAAEALSFSYPDGTHALAEVSLEVRKGEFLALMGANGCGKTTLLKHFIGLLKPSSGRVLLDGKELRRFEDREIFRRIGMVFQDPNDQLFAATVEHDVAFGAVNLGLTEDEVAARTGEALRLVGAGELGDKAIHALSFGQKRRVAIAGVLAMEPEVILLDEPTSGLDPRGTSSIMHLLRKLNRERAITMVVATHDVELVPLFCDWVAIMSRGRMVGEETPQRLFADTAMVREAGLRLPRMAHLAEILHKEDGVRFPAVPLTIAQARRALLKLMEGRQESEAGAFCRVDGEEG